MQIHRLGGDISVLNDQLPVPGIGFLPMNAFVLHAAEPVVVDTGLSLPGRGFMDTLDCKHSRGRPDGGLRAGAEGCDRGLSWSV
jgi:hypothetical protein